MKMNFLKEKIINSGMWCKLRRDRQAFTSFWRNPDYRRGEPLITRLNPMVIGFLLSFLWFLVRLLGSIFLLLLALAYGQRLLQL